MILRAPAKVNLHLRVIKKRPDGYHDIETVFERIALFDKIVIRSLKNGSIKISCDDPSVPAGKGGLIYKTVSRVKEKFDMPCGAEIKVYKKIPVAAGLGGGSSDAASVLKGLKRLWKLPISDKAIMKLGKGLGADIPFFLSGLSFGIASGIGDRIKPLAAKKKLWHLITCPPVKLLARDIYAAHSPRSPSGLIPLEKNPLTGLTKKVRNDLEKTIFKKAPVVERLKKAMREASSPRGEAAGFTHTLVSGSGPSVFSLFNTRKEAMRAKSLLKKHFPATRQKGWKIFIVQTF